MRDHGPWRGRYWFSEASKPCPSSATARTVVLLIHAAKESKPCTSTETVIISNSSLDGEELVAPIKNVKISRT